MTPGFYWIKQGEKARWEVAEVVDGDLGYQEIHLLGDEVPLRLIDGKVLLPWDYKESAGFRFGPQVEPTLEWTRFSGGGGAEI
jgi:hypothetical protein